ncbi:hypothetical protein [Ktedonobacter robiniae]|uniref:non-specific serine/threonine protein kinase n=1 Tax=Ktedonobacter robiniae TaxID=2778365 RepID=A0ABQ3V3T1_9CHLR|nr:hypothetical protein [Ktedonobacter robiniae]GHO59217.1 hypothetical protein KSB_76920 [Ktedonobacter robiniae]
MSLQTREHMRLQDGQYTLVRPLERSAWSDSFSEVWWLARSTLRQNEQGLASTERLIAEVRAPLTGATLTKQLQPMLRTLLALQGHPQHVQLQDMFSEHASHYFVFASPHGQTLGTLMQRNSLLEEDVRLCCLAVIESLHAFAHVQAQQGMASIAHGGITPHHVIATRSVFGPRWIVSQPSLLLASSVMNMRGEAHVSSSVFPYYPPEFQGQGGDTRADLYALLACAYHALTGTHPGRQRQDGGAIPQAQWLNANISTQMNAVLAKGLHPHPEERFQHPAELYQALGGEQRSLEEAHNSQRRVLAAAQSPAYQRQGVAVGAGASSAPSGKRPSVQTAGWPTPLTFEPAEPETKTLLPHPEDFPPLPALHEWRTALCWLGGIAVCETALLVLAR